LSAIARHAATSRTPTHRMPRTTLARPRHAPPEAAGHLSRAPSQADPRPATRRSPHPRHVPTCHPRRAGWTRTPRPGGPSVTPLPRAPYYGRDITPSSPLVGPPLFKRPPFLLAPPDHAPAAPPCPPWPPPSKPPPFSPLGHRTRE
jgi:hypothetical protein